jgi:hypothetical protein
VRSGDAAAGDKVRAALPVKAAVLAPDLTEAAQGATVRVVVGHDFADAPQREASAVR